MTKSGKISFRLKGVSNYSGCIDVVKVGEDYSWRVNGIGSTGYKHIPESLYKMLLEYYNDSDEGDYD